jgi:hypothetical protein
MARVWEMQARGVLHVHPVLAYGTARQKAGGRAYLARLAVVFEFSAQVLAVYAAWLCLGHMPVRTRS